MEIPAGKRVNLLLYPNPCEANKIKPCNKPLSVVAVAHKILNGDFKSGYQSPVSAFGESIINDIPDVSIVDL